MARKRLPANPEWIQIVEAILAAENDFEKWYRRMKWAMGRMDKAKQKLKALRKRADNMKGET